MFGIGWRSVLGFDVSLEDIELSTVLDPGYRLLIGFI